MGDDFLQDLRYAARSLRRAPGFAAVAIVTLALGIGANTAMFSVLNTYLFRPLPYPQPEQLVQVFRTSIHSDSWPHSAANFVDFRERNDVFAEMVTFNGMSPVLIRDGQPAERLSGMSVSGNFFAALGVPPALGRVFSDEEDQPDADNVIVLSDRVWRNRFGADPSLVGRTLQIDGQSVQVIGVMPADVRASASLELGRLLAPDRVHSRAAPESRQQLPAGICASQARRRHRQRAAVDADARRKPVARSLGKPEREPAAGAAPALGVERGVANRHVVHVRAGRFRAADRLRQSRESPARSQRRTHARAQRPRRARRKAVPAAASIDDREPRSSRVSAAC